MYDYNFAYLERLAGLTAMQRQTLMRYYAKLPEQVRIEAHKLQTDLIRQRRQEQRKDAMPEYCYAMLILALRQMQWIEQSHHLKASLTLEQAKKITEIRLARARAMKKKKDSPLRYLIEVRLFEEIQRLREVEGMSWREVCDYLAKYHRRRISHTYLQRVFTDVKNRLK